MEPVTRWLDGVLPVSHSQGLLIRWVSAVPQDPNRSDEPLHVRNISIIVIPLVCVQQGYCILLDISRECVFWVFTYGKGLFPASFCILLLKVDLKEHCSLLRGCCFVIYFAIHLLASASAAFSNRAPLLLRSPDLSHQSAEPWLCGRHRSGWERGASLRSARQVRVRLFSSCSSSTLLPCFR